jgi:hypothetical protein
MPSPPQTWMNHAVLGRFGRAMAARPNTREPPREVFVIQLREALEDWQRRACDRRLPSVPAASSGRRFEPATACELRRFTYRHVSSFETIQPGLLSQVSTSCMMPPAQYTRG